MVWSAPTTTDRDRKELLSTLLTEVTISLDRAAGHADLVLRWKGGALTDLRVPLTTRTSARLRTDEDTIDLVRRLAVHYPDAQYRRHPQPAKPFHRNRTALHRRTGPACAPLEHPLPPPDITQPSDTPTGHRADAAAELQLPPPTLHRWITEGFITGEQTTPGAPWRIRLTDQVRAPVRRRSARRLAAMLEATLAHGLSRQTIMKNIKTGDLQAVYVRTGRRKGLRIKHPAPEQALFQA